MAAAGNVEQFKAVPLKVALDAHVGRLIRQLSESANVVGILPGPGTKFADCVIPADVPKNLPEDVARRRRISGR